MKKKPLSSWSWQTIEKVYFAYSKLLVDYRGYKIRCHIPDTIDISYPDENNILIIRFNRDVDRIDDHLAVLDQEIMRRNNLIGVMG